MGLDLDPCLVRSVTGELLARGFVREHDGDAVLIEAGHVPVAFLRRGDRAVVELMNADRGACTYDAVVDSAGQHGIALVGLSLRHRVQQRTAVRTATALPHRITTGFAGEDRVTLERPLDVVVVDVSGTGLRFRCATRVRAGTRLAMTFTATRPPVELVLEVLREDRAPSDLAHGCRFLGLGERAADGIYRFVLEEQRRALAQRTAVRRP